MFDTFMLVSSASEYSAARRKSLLLFSLGRESQRLVYSTIFETEIGAAEFDELQELLGIQFMPKVNVIAERFRFKPCSHYTN